MKKGLNKKTIDVSAKLEIESMGEITPEVIVACLKGIDCWMDPHNIDGRIYITTLTNVKHVTKENL